jgi:hypothetical protein
MAEKLTTQSLNAAVAESLSWLGDYGFAYFKSHNHFRRCKTSRPRFPHSWKTWLSPSYFGTRTPAPCAGR